MGTYIADFVSLKNCLVIEVDVENNKIVNCINNVTQHPSLGEGLGGLYGE